MGGYQARQSLSRQLLIPLVMGFVSLVIIITALVFLDMGSSLEQSIKKRLLTTAETNKTQLETLFSYQSLNTAAWAKLEVMDDIITDDVDGRISRSLHELKSSYQLQGDILVFNDKRQLIASSTAAYAYDSSQMGLPSSWNMPATAGVSFGGKHFDPFNGQSSVAFLHQISASFDAKTPLGFLVVTIPWSMVERILGSTDNHALLLDHDGSVLINMLDGNSLDKVPNLLSANDEITIANTDYLMGASVLKAVLDIPLNWTIISLEHKNIALMPVVNLGKNISVVAVSLTLLVVLLVIWLTRRVVKPIQLVTQTVLDITQSSDLTKRVNVNSANETGILADSFNKMTENLAQTMSEKDLFADRLAKLNKNLEQQVADRTQAYRDANKQLEQTVQQLQQAQTQLVQSEKMASLGQLVAGIAHEINNPLGAINANIPVLLEYTQDLFATINSIEDKSQIDVQLQNIDYDFMQDDTPKLLDSIRNATSRMKEIVLSLRNFSRLDQAEEQDILLEEALDTTLALLAHRLKNRITVEKHYQLNLPVSCYPGLMNQVFMNLLANAEQAIEGDGQITIMTQQKGDDAVVMISDTGTGIDAATMNKIFDPFFTTKPVGEGTGMGLSISYGIIEQHHGQIQVESEPGQGTRFIITLPMQFGKSEVA